MDSIRSLFCILSMGLFLTTVSCQQSVVSSNSIPVNGIFAVYCDAGRVNLPDPSITSIRMLTINRMTATDTTEVKMMQFQSLVLADQNPYYFNKLPNRDWNATYMGGNQGVNNKETMKLVWTLNDAGCEDAGLYRCIVTYSVQSTAGRGIYARNSSQNVTAVADTSGFVLSVYPDNINNGQQYKPGDNITFTCKVMGPSTLVFRWETVTLNEDDTDSTRVVEVVTPTPGPSSGTGDCIAYTMVSTLNIQIEENSPETTYRCTVTFYNQEVGSGNITIGTGQVSGQQPLILPNSVSVGKPFTVYCDADHVNLYDTAITSIRGLSIYRIVETDTTEVKIAEYQALIVSGENPYYLNIPQGRDWNITFTGANQGSNNRQTMKLVWTVRDTKPDDAGLYRCQVTYYRNTARGGMTDSITRSQIIGICSCEK